MLNAEQLIQIINITINLDLDPFVTPRDVDIKELGVDSLDFFSILTELEKITQKNVSDNDVEKMKTINSILRYFNE